jgi:hypothetical protein
VEDDNPNVMQRWLISGGVGALSVVLAACAGQAVPTVPAGAQQVRVTTGNGVVRIAPSSVEAGDVWFVFAPDPQTQHVDSILVHRGGPMGDAVEPLTDADVERLGEDAAPVELAGLSYVSGFGPVYQATLPPGRYAFILAGQDGPQPGEAPTSIAILVVEP